MLTKRSLSKHRRRLQTVSNLLPAEHTALQLQLAPQTLRLPLKHTHTHTKQKTHEVKYASMQA